MPESKRKPIVSPILDCRPYANMERGTCKAFLAAVDAKVREVVRDSMRIVGRKETAFRMTNITGRPISVHSLNSWAAPSREHARFPVVYVDAFCRATDDDTLKRLLLGVHLREMLELGERAAAILNERAQQRLRQHRNGRLKKKALEKRNGRCAA